MKSNQIRRVRPNLKDAHRYHKEGGYSVDPYDHYLRDRERDEEIERIVNALINITKHFPRTQNLEYAILKSHLIMEFSVTEYIRAFSSRLLEAKDIRFTFSQKLEIAYFMGFGGHSSLIIPTLEGLNRTRNQIAHNFTFDLNEFDEILRLNSEDYHDFRMKNNRDRISRLRNLCYYLCAYTSGYIESSYFAEKQRDVDI